MRELLHSLFLSSFNYCRPSRNQKSFVGNVFIQMDSRSQSRYNKWEVYAEIMGLAGAEERNGRIRIHTSFLLASAHCQARVKYVHRERKFGCTHSRSGSKNTRVFIVRWKRKRSSRARHCLPISLCLSITPIIKLVCSENCAESGRSHFFSCFAHIFLWITQIHCLVSNC